MVDLIAHRKNTLDELNDTHHRYGVEVDIRTYGDRLVVHHDPCVEGEDFVEWLSGYRHGTLILNVKEEGLEPLILDLMERFGITDYFFLDQSFPFLVKWSKKGLRQAAVRVSEFESLETALTLAGKVDWVWVDHFSKFPLSSNDAVLLQDAGFKLCLVSPELQGEDPVVSIPFLNKELIQKNITPEAICTKFPNIWEECLPK